MLGATPAIFHEDFVLREAQLQLLGKEKGRPMGEGEEEGRRREYRYFDGLVKWSLNILLMIVFAGQQTKPGVFIGVLTFDGVDKAGMIFAELGDVEKPCEEGRSVLPFSQRYNFFQSSVLIPKSR